MVASSCLSPFSLTLLMAFVTSNVMIGESRGQTFGDQEEWYCLEATLDDEDAAVASSSSSYPQQDGFIYLCSNDVLMQGVDITPAHADLPYELPVTFVRCQTNQITHFERDCLLESCFLVSIFPGSDGTNVCSSCNVFRQDEDDDDAISDNEHKSSSSSSSTSSFLYSLTYDCRNLFPDDDCAVRDAHGQCWSGNSDHEHWACVAGRQEEATTTSSSGYACRSSPSSAIARHDGRLTLFCANDISGLDPSDCEHPFCLIHNATGIACASCTLVVPDDHGTPWFAYDCLEAFPNLTCSVLNTDRECETVSAMTQKDEESSSSSSALLDVNQTYASRFAFATTDEKNQQSTQGFDTSFTVNIDPSLFNVLSDIFGVLSTIFICMAIAALHPVLMTWHLQKGKTIPIDELGVVPGDSFEATRSFRVLQWSLPGLILVALLLVADFSHSAADAGLDFVTFQQEGHAQFVLSLIKETPRNPGRPIQTSGDPRQFRTKTVPKSLQQGDLTTSHAQRALIDAYTSAVELFVRGDSPFVTGAPTYSRAETSVAGVPAFDTTFTTDNTPLVAMDLEIPLDCAETGLASIPQITNDPPPFGTPLESTARLPNCTFGKRRSSGIYGEPAGQAQVLEHAEITVLETSDVRLLKRDDEFRVFEASPASKRLARDRTDWRHGRVFYDIDGFRIGNLFVHLNTVVMATGADVYQGGLFGQGSSARHQVEYGLIGSIAGKCPRRPSGLPTSETGCFTVISLACDPFPEDSAYQYHDLYASINTTSTCTFTGLNIVWGRNFVIDSQLVALMAGVFGMVRPTAEDGSWGRYCRHAALAAVFALGVVEERPSQEEVILPRFNAFYVIFMLLPIILSIVLIAISESAQNKLGAIPQSAWELMVLAKEEPFIPRRINKVNKFPEVQKDLAFTQIQSVNLKRGRLPIYGVTRQRTMAVRFAVPSDPHVTTTPVGRWVGGPVYEDNTSISFGAAAPENRTISRFKPEALWNEDSSQSRESYSYAAMSQMSIVGMAQERVEPEQNNLSRSTYREDQRLIDDGAERAALFGFAPNIHQLQIPHRVERPTLFAPAPHSHKPDPPVSQTTQQADEDGSSGAGG